MTPVRHWAAAALSAWLIACGSEIPPPTPPSFDRPGRVAFVCFQTTGRDAPQPWPMRFCENKEVQDSSEADLAMHALVLQTSRGEVAAVDLEKRRVLDSRVDIPGYTFLPVGELPSAIVVPPEHAQQTYVANYGSRTVTVLRTGAFRDLSVGENATLQTIDVIAPGDTTASAPVDMVITPDEDALIVALPDAGKLLRLPIIRCSDDLDCKDGTIDEAGITAIALDASIGRASVPAATGTDEEPYVFACDPDALLPAPKHVGAMLPGGASMPAQPVSLAVDAFCLKGAPCTRRLLVADRAQPILHVLDLDALAAGADPLLDPIVTGVPTLAVAVTPRVPKNLELDGSETQYVYAIDATDGSVLVTENGRLLSVNSDPETRPDRVSLSPGLAPGPAVAAALSVLTPEFNVTKPAAQFVRDPDAEEALPNSRGLCLDADHDERTQQRLRGVFLSVALTDGSVRIVDIHDMELAQCRSCVVGKPDPFPVLRHRERIAAVYTPDDDRDPDNDAPPRLAPVVTPLFRLEDLAFSVAVDGTTTDPRIEGLSCVPCNAPMLDSFPDPTDLVTSTDTDASVDMMSADLPDAGEDASMSGAGTDASVPDAGMDAGTGEIITTTVAHRPGLGHRCPVGEARVCALADPWSSVDDWYAAYEGVIPGTAGGHGRFVPPESADNTTGKLEFAGEIDFCSNGAQAGDQLVITSEMPELSMLPESIRDDCETIADTRDEDALIAFPIEAVFGDRVQIGTELTNRALPTRLREWDFVSRCFANMLASFDMRTRGAFTVVSPERLGFLHRNVLNASTNRCTVDTTQSPLLNGRAYEDKPYTNALISFEIASRRNQEGVRIAPSPGTTLQLVIQTAAPKVAFDGTVTSFDRVRGVLPVELRYNDVNQSVYVVDQAVRGLIPLSTDPFPTATSLSFQ